MTDELPLSRTQRKMQMLALQDLGAELVELKEQQIDALALPETLREAVLDAQHITKFEARRRQLQYIGKLMRAVDPAPIRARLEAWKSSSSDDTAHLHRLERWRERLLDDDAALAAFVEAHPRVDTQQLRALIRNAQQERDMDKPPRSYRALFRFLRSAIEDTAQKTSGEDAE